MHFFLIRSNKVFYTSIIGFFYFIREETGGYLSTAPVIAQAFATHAFLIAGIRTVTSYFVFLDFTFHRETYLQTHPTNFLNSSSLIILTPIFFAFSYFEPGFSPTTT